MNPIDQYEIRGQMDDYLIRHGGWVPGAQLAYKFGVKERNLRGEDGLLAGLAISGDAGYRALMCASDDEFDTYCNRIRSHAISELRRIQRMKRNRTQQQQLVMAL